MIQQYSVCWNAKDTMDCKERRGISIILNFLAIIAVHCVLCAPLLSQTPKPTKAQLAWHEKEFYIFMHFGPNTFTDREWGEGIEPSEIFNPVKLDTKQWCDVAKAAGAKGIIITAKHHDGFCLWPSKFSKHTVRESNWKNGKGDVLKELSNACKAAGLKFGIYISPWDRNHPDYGTDRYNDVFVGMMKEIFTSYGPVWELWWDGANGEGPNGKKQVYDWRRYENTVRKLSPSTVIFSDIGPDIRWVGNEKGIAGDPNWNFLDTAGFKRGLGAPPEDTLNHGNYNGKHWIPGECDVSIRPGWFWHAAEDQKVKKPDELFSIYLKSVGRGANLLLNVPPDSNGLITRFDQESLFQFRKLIDENFSTNLFPRLANTVRANCVELKEDLSKGQRIRKFLVRFYKGDNKLMEISGTSVGRKKLVSFKELTFDRMEFEVNDKLSMEYLSEIKLYLIDERLLR